MADTVEPVRNKEGETPDMAEARFLKERVTRRHAVLYAMTLADKHEAAHDLHHAAFYRTVARLLVIHEGL